MDGPPEASDSSSKQNVNITNISGTIQGPVFMGNENVSFGGGKRGLFSSTPFNDGVPLLKPSGTEITPNDGVIAVGGASLEYLKHTVQEAKRIALTYKVDTSETPKDCIRASSVLTCAPKFSGRRPVSVRLPIYCSTRKSVAASVYKKDEEGRWQLIEENLLADDRQIFASAREISNMAAFIPKERMVDVKYSIACFLFNNADGQFVMGFCLDDEAIKAAFCHRITTNGFIETVHIPDILQTCLGDEIAFKISPGQTMTNTKMTVDENFVSGLEGFMSRCTLDKEAEDPQYFIIHYRNGKEIDDYVYGVKSEKSKNHGVSRGICFRGNADVGNVIDSANYVEIDQSTYRDKEGATRENDQVRYSDCDGLKEKERQSRQDKSDRGIKYRADGTPRKIGGIIFEGEAKIGNVVQNASIVKINQSNRSRGNRKSSVEKIVHPKQPEHEDETTKTIEASGDVENKATPISLDCEKKEKESTNVPEGVVRVEGHPIWTDCEQQTSEETATVKGEGTVEDDAQPIWRDCEKQAQQGREQSETETDIRKQTHSNQHEEGAAGKNDAAPIRDENSEDSDSETQSGGISSGTQEIDLKKSERRTLRRKGKVSNEMPKIQAVVVPGNGSPKESGKEQPSQSFDTWHYVMIAIIGILLYIIVMLQGGGSS